MKGKETSASLLKGAQGQKTKQAVMKLIEWYATKEEFYKVCVASQQTIIKNTLVATEMTLDKLSTIANIVKEEKQTQGILFQRNAKNTLSSSDSFAPKQVETTDPQGNRKKVDLPLWSGNLDRIFLSLGQQQRQKQALIKKGYKTLQGIQELVSKQESKYRSEVKKPEKELESFFEKLDDAEKQEAKLIGKLVKESKSEQLKESAFFIAQLKKVENLLVGEVAALAERGQKLLFLIKTVIRLEKEVAKVVKEACTQFLAYRKNCLGIDSKGEEQIYGQVALCEDKIEYDRVNYFNKMLLRSEAVENMARTLPSVRGQSNWDTIVKFLQMPKQELIKVMRLQESMLLVFKSISYRCWLEMSLAQGWFIESYTPSVMYMTYDSTMIIYSREGELLKKIHTSASKISKIEGNTVFLQERIKGFFSDTVEEYKIRFELIERLEEFQLFMENQI